MWIASPERSCPSLLTSASQPQPTAAQAGVPSPWADLRGYEPARARYIEADPIGLDGASIATMNLYAYARQNPINFIDPSGLAQTLSYQTTGGGPNLAYWQINWQLSEPSPTGGYIVQQITGSINGIDNGQPFSTPYSFWEAWQVPAGSQTSTPCSDQFHVNPRPDNTATGTDSVTATASFYEGLTLPPDFIPNGDPLSGGVPSTDTNPDLSPDDATPPVIRNWSTNF
jgi:hypothetical protein